MNDLTSLFEQAHHELRLMRERVLADAASGHGPQPWERDWPLGEFDLCEHLESSSFNPDDKLICHLLTMVQWALESPLGRQALTADGSDNNPGQHTLDTLRVFRSSLVQRRRALLSSRQNEPESWADAAPLGDFHLFEHITTCQDFNPDWFTTGELLEMADWALSYGVLPQMSWEEDLLEAHNRKPVIDVIYQFGQALGVHRKRLLLAQAKDSLGYSQECLEHLERCLLD